MNRTWMMTALGFALAMKAGGCVGVVGSLSDDELDTMPLEELEQMAVEMNPDRLSVHEALIGRTGAGVPGTAELAVEDMTGELLKVQVPYEDIDGTWVTAGDIILQQGQEIAGEPDTRQPFGFSVKKALRWPKGLIPYVIAPGMDDSFRYMVKAAMRRWQEATGGAVRFKKRRKHSSYVYLTRRDGCWSHLGRIGGRQELSLGGGCGYHAALHELGHAIGLHHEHQRPNRDKHIKIVWENIPRDWWDQMYKMPQRPQGNVATAYDPRSIMHYESGTRPCIQRVGITMVRACVDGVAPWLVTLGGELINGNTKITKKDIKTVKRLYEGA